jgi:hypothetical protein
MAALIDAIDIKRKNFFEFETFRTCAWKRWLVAHSSPLLA